MKKISILISVLLFSFSLSGCDDMTTIDLNNTETDLLLEEEKSEIINEASNDEHDDYGSLGALDNVSFTIEEMLVYALQDEYAARQEYTYIIENFDITKPFTNIIESEETHISLLLPLFETYDITQIEDSSLDHIISIEDIEDAFATGVQAEILNIAMYNLFLTQDELPEDIKDVFIELRDASENHLAAFQKNLDKLLAS
jgi:hypothetical protein